ncbi:MAG: RMD1 family protein, partial [Bdellovibrionales bacterium]|nr:RMD1 family protein [Bdellovibrionales bacterium]
EEMIQTLSKIFSLNTSIYKYDDYKIEVQPDAGATHRLDFNKVVLQKFDFEAVRIIALSIGQSVALDYYQSITVDLLAETKDISEELRTKGRSTRNIKNLVRYMGACMSTKQSLTDDLYIYDEPDESWDNQNVSKLFEEAKRHLEIQSRFKGIYYDLDLIQQSSEMVADLIHIRKQNVLELTIVGLIAFEVAWLIIDKFL